MAVAAGAGAWAWVFKIGKAIGNVVSTVVRWAWNNPAAAAGVALGYAIIRRIAEKRRKSGRAGVFEMFMQDLFAPIGDYASTLLLIVAVGRGLYELYPGPGSFNPPWYDATGRFGTPLGGRSGLDFFAQ